MVATKQSKETANEFFLIFPYVTRFTRLTKTDYEHANFTSEAHLTRYERFYLISRSDEQWTTHFFVCVHIE